MPIPIRWQNVNVKTSLCWLVDGLCSNRAANHKLCEEVKWIITIFIKNELFIKEKIESAEYVDVDDGNDIRWIAHLSAAILICCMHLAFLCRVCLRIFWIGVADQLTFVYHNFDWFWRMAEQNEWFTSAIGNEISKKKKASTDAQLLNTDEKQTETHTFVCFTACGH